jgi:hypothetical protein
MFAAGVGPLRAELLTDGSNPGYGENLIYS